MVSLTRANQNEAQQVTRATSLRQKVGQADARASTPSLVRGMSRDMSPGMNHGIFRDASPGMILRSMRLVMHILSVALVSMVCTAVQAQSAAPTATSGQLQSSDDSRSSSDATNSTQEPLGGASDQFEPQASPPDALADQLETQVNSALLTLAQQCEQIAQTHPSELRRMVARHMQMRALMQLGEQAATKRMDLLASQRVFEVRSAAAKVAVLPGPVAELLHRFWQLQADLFDLNRSGVEAAVVRRQAIGALEGFRRDLESMTQRLQLAEPARDDSFHAETGPPGARSESPSDSEFASTESPRASASPTDSPPALASSDGALGHRLAAHLDQVTWLALARLYDAAGRSDALCRLVMSGSIRAASAERERDAPTAVIRSHARGHRADQGAGWDASNRIPWARERATFKAASTSGPQSGLHVESQVGANGQIDAAQRFTGSLQQQWRRLCAMRGRSVVQVMRRHPSQAVQRATRQLSQWQGQVVVIRVVDAHERGSASPGAIGLAELGELADRYGKVGFKAVAIVIGKPRTGAGTEEPGRHLASAREPKVHVWDDGGSIAAALGVTIGPRWLLLDRGLKLAAFGTDNLPRDVVARELGRSVPPGE